ncbi:MAG: hypothetical protein KGL39_19055 [Patescibacteria group bacterium]|nr:hypothetical protein [Patescibacteria group bacterium]
MPPLNSSIGDVLITKYANSVFELASQTEARTRQLVNMVQVEAENMMFPRVGYLEAQTLDQRSPIITPSDLQWDNRKLSTDRFGVACYIDNWDAERMLSDPKSEVAKRTAEALERNFDRKVVASLNATVYTGRQGTTAVTASSDGVVTVDGTGGITYDLLLQLDANFQSVELGTETNVRKFLLVSEKEHQQLMKEGTLINGDFSNQYVVDKGRMTRALDFDIIMFGSAVPNPILPIVSGSRQCYAVVGGQVNVGMTQSWKVDVQPVNNRWETVQVLTSGIFGATRMQGLGVQVINTNP